MFSQRLSVPLETLSLQIDKKIQLHCNNTLNSEILLSLCYELSYLAGSIRNIDDIGP